MRRIIFLAIAFLFTIHGISQTSIGNFGQDIFIKKYRGKDFRLEAAIKVLALDTFAKVNLFATVEGKQRKGKIKTIRSYQKEVRSAEDTSWKIYSLEGSIDKKANGLIFGSFYIEKGIYFFDDFRIFITSKNGTTVNLPIVNPNFEIDSLTRFWYRSYIPIYRAVTTTESVYRGNWSFKVDCSKRVRFFVYGKNDSAGNYAVVNGIKIYFETYGAGEPLLLLHGNGQFIGAFARQISELSKFYRVIAVDTRGQGRSSEDGKKYSYDLFAEDINALLNYLHIDKASILGWSDGGNTGLILAMKYPDRVKTLITMGANIFIDKTVVSNSVFRDVNKGINYFSKDTSYDARNKVRLFTMLLTEPKYQFKDLAAIKCPVLVIAGEKDIIQSEHTKGIAANIQKGKLYIAPKETHFYPQKNPISFNKIVLDFLKGQEQ